MPTEETMVLIAKGLKCTVGDLLGESGIQNEKKPTANPDDELKKEIIDLIGLLPEDDLPQIRDYVAWLKSRHAKQ